MKLEKLLEKLNYTLDAGDLGIEVASLEYDSRKVGKGSLFVCLTGFRADGHEYIPAALEAGAAALVVEREGKRETVRSGEVSVRGLYGYV